jgi:O-succinylbenzoate synthase
MKITKMEILRLTLPMIHSFETSFGKFTGKETIITKLYADNGLVGYGESSGFFAPVYNHETVNTCAYIQEKYIGPNVVGKSFQTAADFKHAYGFIVGNKVAQTGPECAFWHLLSQEQNKSLKQLVGGTRSEIAVGESIGIHPTIEATLAEVEQRLAEGYVRIKVKIKPGWDVDLMRAIRQRWPDIDLMADGNSAYRLPEHLPVLQQLDDLNLTMIEQPLAHDDIIDHATLQIDVRSPICLDESIESVEDARKAIQIGACKIINIKPGRMGGLVESIKTHDLAQKAGVGVWCGGLLETGIGRAFNIAVASKENYIYPADMSPYDLFYQEDLIEPSFVVKPNGHIDVPDTPGLGYEINQSAIKRFTSETITVK